MRGKRGYGEREVSSLLVGSDKTKSNVGKVYKKEMEITYRCQWVDLWRWAGKLSESGLVPRVIRLG